MKLLLDTHIWIWLLENPDHLAPNARRELADPGNELWLSPISTWEVLTLHRKGRMRLPKNPNDWLPQALAGIQRHAPITQEVVLASERVATHLDPVERLLAGTALVHDLVLVTADRELLALGTIRTMGNR